MKQALLEVVEELDGVTSKNDLNILKAEIARKHSLKKIPSNISVFLSF